MKKFKLLIAGLFTAIAFVFVAVTGIKVNAATTLTTQSNTYVTYTNNGTTATWVCNYFKGSNTAIDNNSYGLIHMGSKSVKFQTEQEFMNIPKTGIYIPVPSGAAGTIKLDMSANGNPGTYSIYNGTTSFNSVTTTIANKTDDVKLTFTSEMLYTSGDNKYVGFTTSSNLNLKGFTIELTSSSYTVADSEVTLAFDAQYNTENSADATMLRFIGTINGIAYDDYADISSAKFTFTFNGASKEANLTHLYKSVSSVNSSLTAADNKMYVVLTLNNIKSYSGYTLSDCLLTVTLNTGVVKSISHADIKFPTFTA